MRILLTGGTGMVGSVLARALKKSGEDIVFVTRQKNGQSPLKRIQEYIPEIGDRDAVIAGDLQLPKCGISTDDLKRWRGQIDCVVHCGASISFDEEVAEDTAKTNVEGTKAILNLCEDLGISELHYMSTAYVAGDAYALGERDIDIGQNFRNPYEKSKLEAEKIVREWENGRWSIYRLGIIVGDSVTGHSVAFSGYYGFFKGIVSLRNQLIKNWSTMSESLIPQGVNYSDGGVTLPLLFRNSAISTLNLVTSDWMADIVTKLIAIPPGGKTYQIVHSTPPLVDNVIRWSLDHLGIRGYKTACSDHEQHNSGVAPLVATTQTEMDRKIEKFLPYITHEAKFSESSVAEDLGDNYRPHPDITPQLLGCLLDYACSVKFGKIFSPFFHEFSAVEDRLNS